MRELPHLVEMQNKYAKDGLVVLSMNLDDPKNEELHGKVKAVLAREHASFVALGPPSKDAIESVVEHWKFSAIPQNVVYGRDGKLVKRIEGGDIDEINKVVQDALARKE